MLAKLRSRLQFRSPATLAAAASLVVCAIGCTTLLLLAAVGVGTATALACNVYEAGAWISIAGFTAAGAVLLVRKRRQSANGACPCATSRAVADAYGDARVACELGAFTADERAAHLGRSRVLFSAISELHEEIDGYTFSFEADAALENEMDLWIEGERRCCPFFRFQVDRLPGGLLSLRVTGPGTAKEILRTGLQEAERVSPPSSVAHGP